MSISDICSGNPKYFTGQRGEVRQIHGYLCPYLSIFLCKYSWSYQFLDL